MATGFLFDTRFLLHDTGPNHPECAQRLEWIWNAVQKKTWFNELEMITPRLAEEEWLLSIHSREYLERAEETCRRGESCLDTPDVAVCRASYETALLACGGCLAMADALMSNRIRNGFAAVRPPGHHAEQDEAMGFCIINNIAVTAEYLRRQYGLERILIFDWDVHHGNGTQHAYEEDPSVLFISLHQYPHYPGTGSSRETGRGRGDGLTLNYTMPGGSPDERYRAIIESEVLPRAEAFRPDAVLVSAGFDAHWRDPLANIELTTECFGWMTDQLTELAGRCCEGRLLSFLEGGYDPQGLSESVCLHLERLLQA